MSELASHSHVINSFRQYETGSSTDSSKLGRTTAGADGGSSTIATGEAGGNEAHNNLQPYLVENFIIKAKNTAVIKGEIIQENGTASENNTYSAKAIDNKLKKSVKVEESGDGYTKYSDGTMVCYGTASVTNPNFGDWYGFCRLANATTTNLVKTFKDNNYSLTITSKAFGYFTAMITSKTASSFTFRAFTHNNTSYNPGNGDFDYIAIGKWK